MAHRSVLHRYKVILMILCVSLSMFTENNIALSKGLFGASREALKIGEEAIAVEKKANLIRKLLNYFFKLQIKNGLKKVAYREILYSICQNPAYRVGFMQFASREAQNLGFDIGINSLDEAFVVAVACSAPKYMPIGPANNPANEAAPKVNKLIETKFYGTDILSYSIFMRRLRSSLAENVGNLEQYSTEIGIISNLASKCPKYAPVLTPRYTAYTVQIDRDNYNKSNAHDICEISAVEGGERGMKLKSINEVEGKKIYVEAHVMGDTLPSSSKSAYKITIFVNSDVALAENSNYCTNGRYLLIPA